MDKKLITIFILFNILLGFLLLRTASIAIDSDLLNVATSQSRYTISFDTSRGVIYDRNLAPLVDQGEQYVAIISPTIKNLFSLHDVQAFGFDRDLLSYIDKPFLATSIFPSTDYENIEIFSVTKRNTSIATHLIGYTTSGQGVTGVERVFNDLLNSNSKTSTVTYNVNALGEIVYGEDPTINLAPLRLDGVVLTIDTEIQTLVEEIGSSLIQRGAVIVSDTKSGELLAVASFPTFNPDNIANELENPYSPLFNRTTASYSVGSIFKPLIALTAIKQGISPELEYECIGYYKSGDTIYNCHNINGHGIVDMEQAMAVSCNPYFINLATKVSDSILLDTMSDLSFGKATELVPTLYTSKGTVPSYPLVSGEKENLAFGQGLLLSTPIQIVNMYNAIANGGYYTPATAYKGTTTDGKTIISDPNSIVVVSSSDEMQIIQSLLFTAVMETENQNATPTYTTASGKTATAQSGQFVDSTEVLYGWFAGYFPSDDPQYTVVVMVEDAVSGNADASPVFREIADVLTEPEKMPAYIGMITSVE